MMFSKKTSSILKSILQDIMSNKKITEQRILEFKEAIDKFNLLEATRRIGSRILAKAELDALKSQLKDLEQQRKSQ